MATKNYKSLTKRLKKQLTESRRKEKATKKKLKAAIAKVKKVGRGFEKKLTKAAARVHQRTAEVEANLYGKLITLLKGKAKKSKKPGKRKTKSATVKTNKIKRKTRD